MGQGVEVVLSASDPFGMAPLFRLGLLDPTSAPEVADSLGSWTASPGAVWAQLQKPIGDGLEKRVAEQVRSD